MEKADNKNLLFLAGHIPEGYAGAVTDNRIASALHCRFRSVITALTSQDSEGNGHVGAVPASLFTPQLDAAVTREDKLYLKAGLLPNSEILNAFFSFLEEQQQNIQKFILDPVRISSSGIKLSSLTKEEFFRLAPFVSLITPNIQEAVFLSEQKITTENELLKAGNALAKLFKAVLIKGGHWGEASGEVKDYLFIGNELHTYSAKRSENNCRGTGCALASAIASFLLLGLSLPVATRWGKRVIEHAITSATSNVLNIEEGVRQALLDMQKGEGGAYAFNLLTQHENLSEAEQEIFVLQKALTKMASSPPPLAPLLPEIQANIAYKKGEATDYKDVLGIPGRLVRFGKSFTTVALPAYGASKHIARVLLTCKKYDEDVCCVIALRYSAEILALIEKRGLRSASFCRADEPEDIATKEGSSLEWGTNRAIQQKGYVPDVVYDCGGDGKEPIIRLIGRFLNWLVQEVLFLAEALQNKE